LSEVAVIRVASICYSRCKNVMDVSTWIDSYRRLRYYNMPMSW
jgi:hypothetical protein